MSQLTVRGAAVITFDITFVEPARYLVDERPVWTSAVPCRVAVPCRMWSIRGGALETLRPLRHMPPRDGRDGDRQGLNGHKVWCAECPDVKATTSAALYGNVREPRPEPHVSCACGPCGFVVILEAAAR
jgi:hypothetical protein